MKGKPAPLDLLKLYTQWTAEDWNAFLTKCVDDLDVQKLVRFRYSLQAGMERLVKMKHNTEQIADLFIRWQRSIDNTLKTIWRIKHPNPLYNPKNAHLAPQFIDHKRQMDREFEEFLRRVRY